VAYDAILDIDIFYLPERTMATITRREFLKLGGGIAAGTGAAAAGIRAEAKPVNRGRVTLAYPVQRLVPVRSLAVNEPVFFNYPDEDSPCALIKMGSPVPGGVGPGRDIVAYSILCTHNGCPLHYDSKAKSFKCPCHFSTFDAEMGGQMVCGQATENLPRVVLTYDPKIEAVSAVSVNGLIYGRQSNIL
jgi:arsenite oxidase small subunit